MYTIKVINADSSSGYEQVVELGISQYSFGESGSSACTVIACAVVKLILTKAITSNDIPDIAELTSALQTGISFYRTLPTNTVSHLSVDELGSFMSGTVSARGDGPIQGLLTTPNHFEDMFSQARERCDPTKHVGIIVTKPPETVCVVLPPQNAPLGGNHKYTLFDSHSRPQYGLSTSYMVICDGERGLIQRLRSIFTALDMEGGEDYMQLMYNMFEGSVFQSS